MALRITHEPEIDFSTFPASDGKPVADNEVNLEQMIELILELRQAAEARAAQESQARRDLEAALQAARAELARLQHQEPD